MPFYTNYIDKTLSGYLPLKIINPTFTFATDAYPQKYIAFNTISSNQVIGLTTSPEVTNDPGNVTYVAETSIHLSPGFHAEEGTYFHAYIKDIDCGESFGPLKSINEDNTDYMYTPFFDSLSSVPKVPYQLTCEDSISMKYLIPCPGDTLYFNGIDWDTTTGVYNYYWDFGNGVTSTQKDPKVFYQPGSYNFILILTDTNGISDTANLIIEVPDCDYTVRGVLYENQACGSVPVLYDSIYLVNIYDSIVAGVTPVITDSLGRFWFLLSELQALDPYALFGFKSGNRYELVDSTYRTTADWLSLSPLDLYLKDQLKPEWTSLYNNAVDSTFVIAKTIGINENVYILGKIFSDSLKNDYLLLKYNPAGDLQWAETYNSPYNNSDVPTAMCSDSLNNIFITGYSYNSGGSVDYLTIKYDSSGNQQWVERYDVSGLGSSNDYATDIGADNFGNIYICGHSEDQYAISSLVTIKYNSSGQLQWVQNYYDGDYSQGLIAHYTSLKVDGSGNLFIAGTCMDSVGDNECVIIKYNSSGILQWASKKNNSTQDIDNPMQIAQDLSGNIFVTGNTGTLKYNNDGILQWYQPGDFDQLMIDEIGNVYTGNGKTGNLTSYNNSNGNMLWYIDSLMVNDFSVDYNNDLYVVGDSQIIKFNSSGGIIESLALSYQAVAGSVSANLNFYVVGSNVHTDGSRITDLVTEKYSQCPSLASLKNLSENSITGDTSQGIQSETTYNIIPNPNKGEMDLISNNTIEQGSTLSITDMIGKVVHYEVINKPSKSVHIITSDLVDGIYLYYLVSPRGKLLTKNKLIILK